MVKQFSCFKIGKHYTRVSFSFVYHSKNIFTLRFYLIDSLIDKLTDAYFHANLYYINSKYCLFRIMILHIYLNFSNDIKRMSYQLLKIVKSRHK